MNVPAALPVLQPCYDEKNVHMDGWKLAKGRRKLKTISEFFGMFVRRKVRESMNATTNLVISKKEKIRISSQIIVMEIGNADIKQRATTIAVLGISCHA
ncbi:unnamed protein product [Wuchereria bancrofti]|uniref:Uncharacterized protein n=1 Tax=Wuchereria bancrofti TaxID=6293 RepID=A0A3P7GCV9_WUCBA|nr:unnamed protein product [Wuchereria bancrofti]